MRPGTAAAADGVGRDVDGVRLLLHDMQQPLTVLGFVLSAAERAPHDPDEVQRRLRIAAAELDRIQSLVTHGLQHAVEAVYGLPTAEVDAPDDEMYSSSEDVAELEQLVSDALAPLLELHSRQVRYRHTARPLVGVDASSLRRVIDNLLQNALRAVQDDGHIDVRVGRRGRWAWLSVEDTGPGFGLIPRGSGLGLAGSTATVLRVGGTVHLRPGRLGGLHAMITLPMAARE